MLLEKLDRYVDYIDYLESEEEVPFDEILEKFVNSSSSDRIKMLLEVDDETKQKIKELVDGGII